MSSNASDVHIEPQVNSIFIRFRIDGILHAVESLPKDIQPAFTSRIKVMSNIDITEKRIPQDGQIQMSILNRFIDFRVSTLPSKHGEKIVIRVLDKSSFIFDTHHLGFLPLVQAKYEEMLTTTSGIILVAGPTGSGKTSIHYMQLLIKLNLHQKYYNFRRSYRIRSHFRRYSGKWNYTNTD